MITKDDWKNREFAKHWDMDPVSTFNVRNEQLDILVSVLADGYRGEACILDIGMGSGQVEELIFKRLPQARIVGVDYSSAMLEMADKRLLPYKDRYEIIQHDLRELSSLELNHHDFQYVITSQVLHELPHDNKKTLFTFVHSLLAQDGTFLIADRTSLNSRYLFKTYESIWSRWAQNVSVNNDESFNEFYQRYEMKEDFPATLDEYLLWIREAGFDAECLHLHLNRMLIGAQCV